MASLSKPRLGTAPDTVGAALRRRRASWQRAGIEDAGDDARRLAGRGARLVGSGESCAGRSGRSAPSRVGSARAAASPGAPRASRSRASWASAISTAGAFAISPATLDPRPDSETLVAAALDIVRAEGWTPRRCACSTSAPARAACCDAAVRAAARDRRRHRHQPAQRSSVARDNARQPRRRRPGAVAAWPTPLKALARPFHMLVTNPPYIRTGEIAGLDPEVRDYRSDAGARWRRRRPGVLSPHGRRELPTVVPARMVRLRGRPRSGRRGRRPAGDGTSAGSKSPEIRIHRDVDWQTTLCCRENTWLSIC